MHAAHSFVAGLRIVPLDCPDPQLRLALSSAAVPLTIVGSWQLAPTQRIVVFEATAITVTFGFAYCSQQEKGLRNGHK